MSRILRCAACTRRIKPHHAHIGLIDYESGRENRLARMSAEDREKVENLEEWKRQASETGQALSIMNANRQRGFMPGTPSPTTLTVKYPAGRPIQVDEVPNPMWRDSSQDPPTNEPHGGTIGPDPGSAA